MEPSPCIFDENAFGVLVSYVDIENDEYSLEPEEFAKRLLNFGAELRAYIAEAPPAESASAFDMGHAIYVEFADGEQNASPISWLRQARQRVQEKLGIATVGVLTHGGRWLREADEAPEPKSVGEIPITRISQSSEALRRALYAETATHGDESGEAAAWGAGLYLDTEAVEALSLKLKNAPTPLEIAGATFYRAGS